MNKLLTIIFISISIACFGQPPKEQTKSDSLHKHFSFDALNGSKVVAREQAIKQANETQRAIAKYDSATFWPMIGDFLRANKVDLSRVSQAGDSLLITPSGIDLKLRIKGRPFGITKASQ